MNAMIRRRLASSLLLLAALAAAACGGAREDPILQLSAAESLAQGKVLLDRKEYAEARKYLTHAFEAETNSAAGREGLLLAADSLFLQGGNQNLIQAEAKYRDFQNRFPTSDRAAYVQFQIAKTLARRMEKPDRDQKVAAQAQEAFEALLRLYPTSEFAAQAEQEIRQVKDNLAEHEFLVGNFYLRFGLPVAAAQRFESLLGTYPDYSHRDKVLYHLGLAYRKQEKPTESQAAFERLRSEFPQSPYVAELPPPPPAAEG